MSYDAHVCFVREQEHYRRKYEQAGGLIDILNGQIESQVCVVCVLSECGPRGCLSLVLVGARERCTGHSSH